MTKYLYTAIVRDKEIEEDKPEPDPRSTHERKLQSMVIHPSQLTNVTSLPHLRHTRLMFHAADSYEANQIITSLLDAIPDDHERVIHFESIEEATDD